MVVFICLFKPVPLLPSNTAMQPTPSVGPILVAGGMPRLSRSSVLASACRARLMASRWNAPSLTATNMLILIAVYPVVLDSSRSIQNKNCTLLFPNQISDDKGVVASAQTKHNLLVSCHFYVNKSYSPFAPLFCNLSYFLAMKRNRIHAIICSTGSFLFFPVSSHPYSAFSTSAVIAASCSLASSPPFKHCRLCVPLVYSHSVAHVSHGAWSICFCCSWQIAPMRNVRSAPICLCVQRPVGATKRAHTPPKPLGSSCCAPALLHVPVVRVRAT